MGITNHTVRKSLSENPDKRAFLFMQVGIAYSMYSDLDNECCKLYSKRKLMKKKACQNFELALDLGSTTNNPLFYYYLVLTLYELGSITEAKEVMQGFMAQGVN